LGGISRRGKRERVNQGPGKRKEGKGSANPGGLQIPESNCQIIEYHVSTVRGSSSKREGGLECSGKTWGKEGDPNYGSQRRLFQPDDIGGMTAKTSVKGRIRTPDLINRRGGKLNKWLFVVGGKWLAKQAKKDCREKKGAPIGTKEGTRHEGWVKLSPGRLH